VLLLLSAGSALLAMQERRRAANALAEVQHLQQSQRAIVNLARSLDLRSREMRVLVAVTPTPDQLTELRSRLAGLDAEADLVGRSAETARFADATRRLRASWTANLDALAAGEVPGEPHDPVDLLASLDAARDDGDAHMAAATAAFVDAQRSADRATGVLLGISVVCGAIVVVFLSLTVRRGLSVLDDASRHMQRGDLAYRIPLRGNDEFAAAGRTFNAMADELAAALDEARRARQDAEQASAIKSRFLTAMSHDLRTPLTAVLGFAEIIEEDVREAGLTHTLADVAQLRTGVVVMDGMVGELLELGKLEAGRLPVTWEGADMVGVAADVVAGVRPIALRRRNTVEVVGAASLPLVTDRQKVRHVLQNLVSNAVKFTEQGVVTVRLERWTDESGRAGVEIAVADSGIGMTAEEVSRIFEPFQQANAYVQKRFGGTGLGLAIARGYVDLLGGTIEVTSVPGTGTTFIVRLPDGAAVAGAAVA